MENKVCKYNSIENCESRQKWDLSNPQIWLDMIYDMNTENRPDIDRCLGFAIWSGN